MHSLLLCLSRSRLCYHHPHTSQDSNGSEVSFLQSTLKALGFFTGEVTGYFGAQTEAAVINFQSSKGLDPVGVVGPKTRAVLNSRETTQNLPTQKSSDLPSRRSRLAGQTICMGSFEWRRRRWRLNLQAGDNVLFQGGQTFSGTISLNSSDAGTAANPIVFSSYGSGRATINAGAGRGFDLYNTAGVKIDSLNFVGSGASNTNSGLFFYADLAGNVKLDTILVSNVDVSGFYEGVTLGAWNGTTGFKNVRLTNVVSHDNVTGGMSTYGFAQNSHQSVYIGYSKFYNNPGAAGLNKPSGSGVVFGQVNTGTVEYSSAYNNGGNNTNSAGGAGIWTWDSTNITFQHDEAYSNHTRGGDGDGFDFDGGVTNSVMQYNYSHDNDGAGYLFAEYAGAAQHANNVVRYNISQNDGRKAGYAGIQFWNGNNSMSGDLVYNNTVYVSPASGGSPLAVNPTPKPPPPPLAPHRHCSLPNPDQPSGQPPPTHAASPATRSSATVPK
jgi:peptidoglycan hydrolase-like protein with peptidoglycan-binding domain